MLPAILIMRIIIAIIYNYAKFTVKDMVFVSRDLLDDVEASVIFPVFSEILRALEQGKNLEAFRSLKNNLLIALDGTEYFCSNQIHSSSLFKQNF